MKTQKEFVNKLKNNQTFRTIHYLGSKLRFLDFIEGVVNEIDPNMGGVCDLFAGSGAVSQHISGSRKVVSVDIQKYSTVICEALLNPINDDFIDSFVDEVQGSVNIASGFELFKSLIELEEELINDTGSSDLNNICEFLEHSSLYSALKSLPDSSSQLKSALSTTINKLSDEHDSCYLITKYFGGVFFSYRQTVLLDVILKHIQAADNKYSDILLASLLSTVSDIVNTVGKQFAQPIRPRNKEGLPKKGLLKQLSKDRSLNVFKIYKSWLKKYSERHERNGENLVLNMDFKEAFQYLDESVSVIYADPPYTRDHYSRFYHVLETISLMDHPEVSTTKIGGVEKLSRGLYRSDRHQSDFSIKSKAPSAFEALFREASSRNKSLILSYSPYDKTKGSHPRVVELDFLEDLASKYFSHVETRSLGKFSHSKLNRTDLHLSVIEDSEILLVCRN